MTLAEDDDSLITRALIRPEPTGWAGPSSMGEEMTSPTVSSPLGEERKEKSMHPTVASADTSAAAASTNTNECRLDLVIIDLSTQGEAQCHGKGPL